MLEKLRDSVLLIIYSFDPQMPRVKIYEVQKYKYI